MEDLFRKAKTELIRKATIKFAGSGRQSGYFFFKAKKKVTKEMA
jgi:hypothetical protein